MFCARLPGPQSDWQGTANRSDTAVQREFTNGKDICQVLGFYEVPVRAKNPKSDWQIETSTFLSHVSRRQIDGCFLKRKKERTVVDGCANTFARFPNRQVG